jgi:diguanylate cyclase (GGDEF)-like protein
MSVKVLGGLVDDLPASGLDNTKGFLDRVLNLVAAEKILITVALLEQHPQEMRVITHCAKRAPVQKNSDFLAGRRAIPCNRAPKPLMWKVVEMEAGSSPQPCWIRHDNAGFYIVDDVKQAKKAGYFLPVIRETRSVFLSPLKLGWDKELIGVFAVDSERESGFGAGYETDFLHTLAGVLGQLLDNLYRTYHDPVLESAVKVYHRAYLSEFLERAFDDWRGLKQLCVVFVDLNMFRNINSNFTHIGGDRVIAYFAEAIYSSAIEIRSKTGGNITCFRYGGDEFAFVMNSRKRTDIELLLQSIEKKVQEGLQTLGTELREDFAKGKAVPPLHLSFKAGIASSKDVSEEPKEARVGRLIETANVAMWEVKRKNGKAKRPPSRYKFEGDNEVRPVNP